MVEKRAFRTLRFMNGLRDRFFFDEPVHGFDGLFGEATQILAKLYLPAALAGRMKDGTPGYVQSEHFFQAECLRAKLGVVVVELAAAALFELYRHQRAIGMALDNVAPAAEPELLRPDGQSAQQGYALDGFVAGNVGLLVGNIADYRVLIGPAQPLNCLQCRPSLAEEKVVEERDRDGVRQVQITYPFVPPSMSGSTPAMNPKKGLYSSSHTNSSGMWSNSRTAHSLARDS